MGRTPKVQAGRPVTELEEWGEVHAVDMLNKYFFKGKIMTLIHIE